MLKLVVVLAIASCGKSGGDQDRAKTSEVMIQLNSIGKHVKRTFGETSALPQGKAGPTPSKRCCSYPDKKCPVTDEWRSTKVWQDLDFSIAEPSRFQYTFDGDGKTVTVTATGDLECSGESKTWTLVVRVDNAGNPSITVTQP
jgi:hypothetical protein